MGKPTTDTETRRAYVRHAYTERSEDRRAYDREWYADHPEYRERQIKLKVARRRRHAAWLRGLKTKRGCTDCGERDPVVLDFHHRDPSTKAFTFGETACLTRGRKRLAEEVAKCDVLCANCHRRHHANGV